MIQQIGERSIMNIFNLKKLYEPDNELSELYNNNVLKEFPFYFDMQNTIHLASMMEISNDSFY
jgi:hypothetical protein